MNQPPTGLVLPDGRTMAYSVLGDPTGVPCIFVHGYSSSRWAAAWGLGVETIARHGIRMIAVDRPGYGASTPNPAGGFLDWAADADFLAAHLGLEQAAVIGVSMGSGPALALAARRPDLVTHTVLLGGMPPLSTGEHWAPSSRGDRFYWTLARRAPRLLRALCEMSATAVSRSAGGSPEQVIARTARALPTADREVLEALLAEDCSRQAFTADLLASTSQGGAAPAGDLRRYLVPWGFGPSEITTPVSMWHGESDPKVPASYAVAALADRLPHCTLRTVPGGHFAPFAHRDAVLADAAGR